jgi:hypothetical protein
VRFGVVTLVCVVVVGALGAASTTATGYQGAVGYKGAFMVTIVKNEVTALRGQSGVLTCANGDTVLSSPFALASPVPVTDGKFHAAGTASKEGDDPIQWSLEATVSVGREISGSVTVTGTDPFDPTLTCSKTFPVEAIIPPDKIGGHSHTNFTPGPPPAHHWMTSLRFDYRHGVITHLRANVSTECPDTSWLPGSFYSTAYRLDPIQVNRGRFRIETDVLDSLDVVTHVVISGTINGRVAKGTLSASREEALGDTTDTCAVHTIWKAQSLRPQPTVGLAFYSVQPYRWGHSGHWSYYIAARPNSCGNGVTAVRFSIAGHASRTIACNETRKLGPLRPKHNYHVTATALRTRHGRVISRRRLGVSVVYLPGDDSYWTPGPYIP